MNADPLPIEDPRDRRIATLEAQLATLQAKLAARDVRIAELEAELAAAQRAGKRQATPFARRARKADPKSRAAGQGKAALPAAPPRPKCISSTK
ncbi:MAG: hypothetical protein ACR2M0_02545 [Chloroflexia bacterium]